MSTMTATTLIEQLHQLEEHDTNEHAREYYNATGNEG
jgi:hypothetical protein